MTSSKNRGDDNNLIALEEQISHQNIMLEDLSKIVTNQQNELDIVKKQMAVLAERFLTLEESVAPDIEIQKPPHY